MRDLRTIAKAAEEARRAEPMAKDPSFAALRKARIGTPALVKTPEEEDAYWIVPFIVGKKACGFAFVETTLNVSRLGTFGAGPRDQASWIDASFFERPPPEILSDIKSRYSDMRMSAPIFSYDKTPSKWAWMIKLRDKRELTIFVTPAGWYEQTAKKEDFEG